MSRPRKWRKVCSLPENSIYGPLNMQYNEESVIVMSIEEYETIRLIDLQGFMQEETAEQMNIARTTVQRIYNNARLKLAQALVNGKILKIEGGNYILCNRLESSCNCGGCQKHKLGNPSFK